MLETLRKNLKILSINCIYKRNKYKILLLTICEIIFLNIIFVCNLILLNKKIKS